MTEEARAGLSSWLVLQPPFPASFDGALGHIDEGRRLGLHHTNRSLVIVYVDGVLLM